jgi:hypothetical protein
MPCDTMKTVNLETLNKASFKQKIPSPKVEWRGIVWLVDIRRYWISFTDYRIE